MKVPCAMRRIVRRLQRAQLLASVAVMIVAVITFAAVAILGGNQRQHIVTDQMIDQLQSRIVALGSVHSTVATTNIVTDEQIRSFEFTRQQIAPDLQALKPRIDDDEMYADVESRFNAYLDALDSLIRATRTGALPAGDSPQKAQAATALFDLAGAVRELREHLTAQSAHGWDTARIGFAAAILFLVVAVLTITRLTEHRLRRALLEQERSRLAHVQAQQLTALIENISDAIVVLDETGHVRYASPAIEQLLGRSVAGVIGTRMIDLLHPDDYAANERALRAIIANGAGAPAVTATVRVRRDGGWAWIEAVATNRQNVPGINGIVVNARDITERRLVEEQLRFHALHDPLTGLANRNFLTSHVGKALQRSRRSGSSFAVMFIDLDNFKHINDTWGHAIGDELLIGVAGRLRTVLREGDTAARQGGDEFVLLIEDISSAGDAGSVADRIHDALTLPFAISSREFNSSASIGVFVSDGTGNGSVDDILRYADIAMYRAKRDGRNRTAYFNSLEIETAAD